MNRGLLTREALVIEYEYIALQKQWTELRADYDTDLELMCLIALSSYFMRKDCDLGGPEDGSQTYRYNSEAV